MRRHSDNWNNMPYEQRVFWATKGTEKKKYRIVKGPNGWHGDQEGGHSFCMTGADIPLERVLQEHGLQLDAEFDKKDTMRMLFVMCHHLCTLDKSGNFDDQADLPAGGMTGADIRDFLKEYHRRRTSDTRGSPFKRPQRPKRRVPRPTRDDEDDA